MDSTSPPPPSQQPASPPVHRAGLLAEAWISIGIGGVLLLMFPRWLQWIFARGSFGWTFTDKTGAPMAYGYSAFYWTDLGVTAFAILLILDGILMAAGLWNRIILMGLLASSLAVAIFNFFLVAKYSSQMGLPFYCLLAGVFGLYVAMQQWGIILRLRRA